MLGLEAAGGALPAAGRRGRAPARRGAATTPTRACARTSPTAPPRRSSTRCSTACSASRSRRCAGIRAGALEPRPDTLRLERRLRVPGHLPLRGARRRDRAFTPEQQAAIDRRDGRLLLSANAGSGKTTVLVERFVRTVLEDDIAPGAILAITFTDKAAGELRARVRRELRRARRARRRARRRRPRGSRPSTASARGSCARTRSPPASTRRSPCSTRRRRARRAGRGVRARAGRFLADRDGAPRRDALDLTAAYGVDRVRRMVSDVHDELRSRGQTAPVLPRAAPGRPRRRAAPASPRRAPPRRGAGRRARASRRRARDARALRRLLARPTATSTPRGSRVGRRRRRAEDRRAATSTARRCAAYARGVRRRPRGAAPSRCSTSCWRATPTPTRRPSARGRAWTSTTSSCSRRDLFARAAARRRLRRALRADHGRRVPGHEPAAAAAARPAWSATTPAPSATSCSRSTASATPTSRSSARRRAELEPQGAVASLATNFRTRPEILAALNAAFAAEHERWEPLRAGRADAAGARAAGRAAGHRRRRVGRRRARRARRRAARGQPGRRPRRGSSPSASPSSSRRRLRRRRRRDPRARRDRHGPLRARARACRACRRSPPAAAAAGRASRSRTSCAYLAALANPRDDEALLGLLASPLGGASSDALALLAIAGRAQGRRPWDALLRPGAPRAARGRRRRGWPRSAPGSPRSARAAPRRGLDELLARVVERTGYDLHVLRCPAAPRRLANIHKLLRARRRRSRRGAGATCAASSTSPPPSWRPTRASPTRPSTSAASTPCA